MGYYTCMGLEAGTWVGPATPWVLTTRVQTLDTSAARRGPALASSSAKPGGAAIAAPLGNPVAWLHCRPAHVTSPVQGNGAELHVQTGTAAHHPNASI